MERLGLSTLREKHVEAVVEDLGRVCLEHALNLHERVFDMLCLMALQVQD